MVLTIVSVVLAAAMAFAAVRKLSGRPEVVETYTRLGVPEERLPHLALILLAGAAGLVLGLLWTPLGIAAAAATSLYFTLAVIAHLQAADARNAGVPATLLALALAALLLH
jgi:DoxX-like family